MKPKSKQKREFFGAEFVRLGGNDLRVEANSYFTGIRCGCGTVHLNGIGYFCLQCSTLILVEWDRTRDISDWACDSCERYRRLCELHTRVDTKVQAA